MDRFNLKSGYSPTGDQPDAIAKLTEGINNRKKYQTLLGVTGSGKTFTMANVIAGINRPALVISHNKLLAAQLYGEFKEFFPDNAVEYFVSYYDYYQPEAYIPQTDTYIEKDASINENIDRLRLSATSSLMSRRDCVIVSSVSCIYGLGSPEDYAGMLLFLNKGDERDRDEIIKNLIDIQYERNDVDFSRGKFRVKGDTIDIFPAYRQSAYRVELFGDTIERIYEFDPVSQKRLKEPEKIAIYPAKHFVTTPDKIARAIDAIEDELSERLPALRERGKMLEAQRLESRTRYDIEMLKEAGYCHGIENYSRHLSARSAGSRPYTLIDYFPKDFLMFIDESHVTVPQLRGMYNGDRARKETLVEHGFRLPSALDNRPLKFEEVESLISQVIFASSTPSPFEISKSGGVAEQLIRPTGIIDPFIEIRPSEGQVDDIIARVKERTSRGERTLITTLTKRMSEDLAAYMSEMGIRVKYLHSEIGAIDRVKILRELREKKFDCIVGINLLREGLDLPEVSLVCVLDADKEGFLRSFTSLVQVSGRAARHINGYVVMYADVITDSIKNAVDECQRRRDKQIEFNKRHNIKPRTIIKAISDGIELYQEAERYSVSLTGQRQDAFDMHAVISELQREMESAARKMQFEKAAVLRDQIKHLEKAK
ncbi:MAG: excinuclease ABC subunit B [Candidatus Omnitrophica bacterium CG1_02_49_10]|nr:MAG: excinuclease ABC subunit B [Candidatus Omnitrophica bacterium CG1_02_49_10]